MVEDILIVVAVMVFAWFASGVILVATIVLLREKKSPDDSF